jgi:hypothetical protein
MFGCWTRNSEKRPREGYVRSGFFVCLYISRHFSPSAICSALWLVVGIESNLDSKEGSSPFFDTRAMPYLGIYLVPHTWSVPLLDWRVEVKTDRDQYHQAGELLHFLTGEKLKALASHYYRFLTKC